MYRNAGYAALMEAATEWANARKRLVLAELALAEALRALDVAGLFPDRAQDRSQYQHIVTEDEWRRVNGLSPRAPPKKKTAPKPPRRAGKAS